MLNRRFFMQNRIILGDMPMPKNFKYLNVYLQGKPQHEPFDSFRLKHPSMPLQKRAKIFAPFDALREFDFAIREEEARHLNEYDD